MSLIDMSETYQMTNVGDHIDGTDGYQSNRNLVDNPFFTVRQRGDGPFSSGGYTVDRWKIAGGPPTITPLSGYGVNISQTANTAFDQMIDPNLMPFYNGKTLTLSVYTSAGIFTGTGVLNTSTSAYSIRFNLGTTGFRAGLYNATTSYWFVRIDNITSGATINLDVYAVKLELGSVSTLANDAPPSYAEELAKCKYYYRRIGNQAGAGVWGLTNGLCVLATAADFVIEGEMNKNTGSSAYSGSLQVNGQAVTGMTVFSRGKDDKSLQVTLRFAVGSGLTQYGGAGLLVGAGAYVEISHDL